MRFLVVAVGKPRDRGLSHAIRDYEQRAARYWPLDVREVRAAADDREREWERLRDAVGGARLVLCDEGGRAHDSPAFARWLDALRADAREVAFVIGGAFGVPDAARSEAEDRLALAPWTLPHELARLVLAEQLYRAGTIVRHEPYHK